MSGTFERHVTRYDWPMYRAIGRLRAGESYRGMVVLLVMTGCRLFHILIVLNYYSVSQMYDLVLLGDILDTV